MLARRLTGDLDPCCEIACRGRAARLQLKEKLIGCRLQRASGG
jgi:hypothetical protein